ncbi:MAG: TolC family protein [Thermodesulfobacteriota bacterium]
MNHRPFALFYCWLFFVSFLIPSVLHGQEKPLYNIGIVIDGNTPHDREMVKLFQQEIKDLTDEDFTVRFPETMVLSGGDNKNGINHSLDKLFANPDTHLVLPLGIIASTETLRRKTFAKPVVVPFVLDDGLPLLPNKEGTSGVANLAYIQSMFSLDKQIISFRKITPFSNLAILLDRRDATEVPEITEIAKRLANEHTMTVNLIGVDKSAADAIAAIPPGIEAVMVGALRHLSDEECDHLVKGLIARRLPSYSIWSRKQVDRGLLAGDITADMVENLARRSAVSTHDILLGEEPGSLNVAFSRQYELTINMATARELDIYPSLAIRTGANLLNEQRTDISRRLTLEQAVQEALQANLDLSSAKRKVAAGSHGVNEARSALLPQLHIATGARSIDQDRAGLSGGSNPERAWTGSASGYQQIYSERSWAAYDVEQHNQTARTMEFDAVRLDVIYAASAAYFNVLRAQSVERLQKDNLKLTQANLERARIRMSTGVAGPDEVYRWETKFANDRRKVLETESNTFDAMEGLNRILNRPLQELFIAEETDLSDPLLIVSDRLFFDMTSNPRHLLSFRGVALEEAIALRPELKALDAAIAARVRTRTSAKRQYWLPEVSLEGEVEQYLSEDGMGQRSSAPGGLDDTDWAIGVYARLPLFEGGRKSAALGRSQEELSRLRIERSGLAERVSQDVLGALNRTRASYPGISLSREAADAARRNLHLVTDSYVEGIKSIIELLDAQNQALSADQAAANAVYDFLIDLMGVQRAMGEFIIFLPEEERKAWYERVQNQLTASSTREES